MARTTEADPHAITERVKFVLATTRGTMPLSLVVYSEDDATEARKLLAVSRDKTAAKLVDVIVQKRR
jgi:hypothetical protein